ncbi:site-specific DNA-methyltransferase [Variovorax sp. PDNC026]|uniref:DNA-methyltransferase n=1 Tax=Variovorax sp. PDNC026 TaxID=2811425 RepID=UPI001963B9B2|nr:site-specific DNA-methyltransferase [Variovorax sp. PDNC026]QRY31199.1 site-specific DNA-methyltransferase [Variovorax sp. PDNC026]
MDWLNSCHFGDCLETMRRMPDGIAQTCVTSPPYFGLRDYGRAGQIGLEETPAAFVAKLVEVFGEVRRLLSDDGTLWLNLGDSYAGSWGAQGHGPSPSSTMSRHQVANHPKRAQNTGTIRAAGVKPKDLYGIPWRVAFALQEDGWYLRQDIIWHKPNPMPESIKDRCTKAHEYIFLLSKSERYYFDQGAISEASAESTMSRLAQDIDGQAGSDRVPGKTNGPMKAVGRRNSFARTTKDSAGQHGQKPQFRDDREPVAYEGRRNKRSVWTVATTPYKGAHFATFPTELIEPCVLAGAPAGRVVLDPFFGSGTTGQVAQNLGRAFIGCELNPEYQLLQAERLRQPSLLLEAA